MRKKNKKKTENIKTAKGNLTVVINSANSNRVIAINKHQKNG